MDIYDQATEKEERERAACIAAVRAAPRRDYEAEICNGCDFATKSNWGKTCEAYVECLHDLQRRERAGQ